MIGKGTKIEGKKVKNEEGEKRRRGKKDRRGKKRKWGKRWKGRVVLEERRGK